MATKNNSRTSDLGQILTSGTTGFTVRKRTGLGLFFHFFLLGCMVILGAALLIYYQSPRGCALAVAIGLSFALIAQNLEKLKKSKESVEFMNALFSSALGKDYKFFCVVKNTGDIVFYNRPFQGIFPLYVTQGTRTLDALISLYHIADAEAQKIKALVTSNEAGTVAATIRDAAGAEGSLITFQIDPIERPTTFSLLRGK
jgi:hypothetical protein